jgi:hypothetical protein
MQMNVVELAKSLDPSSASLRVSFRCVDTRRTLGVSLRRWTAANSYHLLSRHHFLH